MKLKNRTSSLLKSRTTSKIIPTKTVEQKLFTCPEEPMYKFPDACVITSCQYHSVRCGNNCISLNKKESVKTISDQELLYYKFDKKSKVPLRNIGNMRRRAIGNVKRAVMLFYILRHIEENYLESNGLVYREGDSPVIDSVISSSFLKLKRMKFKPWMLKFIIDERTMDEVVQLLPIKGLSSDITLKNILNLTPVKFRKLVQAVETASSSQYRESQRLL